MGGHLSAVGPEWIRKQAEQIPGVSQEAALLHGLTSVPALDCDRMRKPNKLFSSWSCCFVRATEARLRQGVTVGLVLTNLAKLVGRELQEFYCLCLLSMPCVTGMCHHDQLFNMDSEGPNASLPACTVSLS